MGEEAETLGRIGTRQRLLTLSTLKIVPSLPGDDCYNKEIDIAQIFSLLAMYRRFISEFNHSKLWLNEAEQLAEKNQKEVTEQ